MLEYDMILASADTVAQYRYQKRVALNFFIPSKYFILLFTLLLFPCHLKCVNECRQNNIYYLLFSPVMIVAAGYSSLIRTVQNCFF